MSWLSAKTKIDEKRKNPRTSRLFSSMKFELIQAGTRSGPFFLQGAVLDAGEEGMGLAIEKNQPRNSPYPLDLDPGLILQIRIKISRAGLAFPVLGQLIWIKPEGDGDFRCGIRYIH